MEGDERKLVEAPTLEQLKGLGWSYMNGIRIIGSGAWVPEGVGI